MEVAISIIIGIAVLSFLVFIHELGHFLAAKFFGVKVEEFGFGFPIPGKIWSIKRGETVYSINWLPAGGFVRLYGEDSGAHAQDPRSFSGKSVWIRIFIAAAGVLMNLALGVILFTILVAMSGFKVDFNLQIPNKFPLGQQTNYVVITDVEKNSPADKGGVKFADKVLTVDSLAVLSVEDLQKYVVAHRGKEITLQMENIKDGSKHTVIATPRVNPKPSEGSLGVSLSQGSTVAYDRNLVEKVFSGVLHSGNMLQYQWVGMKTFFTQSVKERSVAPLARQASGPVGIVAILGTLVQNAGVEAFKVVLNLIAYISLILGVANILPIPAMDGGRLLFFYIEAIRGKKVSAKVENAVHSIGFGVLIILFLLITFNDVVKIFTGRLFG